MPVFTMSQGWKNSKASFNRIIIIYIICYLNQTITKINFSLKICYICKFLLQFKDSLHGFAGDEIRMKLNLVFNLQQTWHKKLFKKYSTK